MRVWTVMLSGVETGDTTSLVRFLSHSSTTFLLRPYSFKTIRKETAKGMRVGSMSYSHVETLVFSRYR